MDDLLGSIINDYILYKIIEGLIAILSLVTIYLGIHLALTWKMIKKQDADSKEILLERNRFTRSTIFIFIAGFFMLVHEYFEGLEKDAPDYVTFELFELIAILGLVLFFYEWRKILNTYRNKK